MNIPVTCPITGETASAYGGTHTSRVPVDVECLLPAVGWARIYVEVMVPVDVALAVAPDEKLMGKAREFIDALAKQQGIHLTPAETDQAAHQHVLAARTGLEIGNMIKAESKEGSTELLRVAFPPLSPEGAKTLFAALDHVGLILPPELEPTEKP
jgi:hypothetical protein